MNAFRKGSPLILDRGEVSSLHHKMVKQYPYYKPILPYHPPIKDRIDDLPDDFHNEIYATQSPKPMFTF